MAHFQVQLDAEWTNFDSKINKILTEALAAGRSNIGFRDRGHNYIVDLHGMLQKNSTTGRERHVRVNFREESEARIIAETRAKAAAEKDEEDCNRRRSEEIEAGEKKRKEREEAETRLAAEKARREQEEAELQADAAREKERMEREVTEARIAAEEAERERQEAETRAEAAKERERIEREEAEARIAAEEVEANAAAAREKERIEQEETHAKLAAERAQREREETEAKVEALKGDKLVLGVNLDDEASVLWSQGSLENAMQKLVVASAMLRWVHKWDPRVKNPKVKQMIGERIEKIEGRRERLQDEMRLPPLVSAVAGDPNAGSLEVASITGGYPVVPPTVAASPDTVKTPACA